MNTQADPFRCSLCSACFRDIATFSSHLSNHSIEVGGGGVEHVGNNSQESQRWDVKDDSATDSAPETEMLLNNPDISTGYLNQQLQEPCWPRTYKRDKKPHRTQEVSPQNFANSAQIKQIVPKRQVTPKGNLLSPFPAKDVNISSLKIKSTSPGLNVSDGPVR